MKSRQAAGIGFLVLIIFGFQNCADKSFAPTDANSFAKTQALALVDGDLNEGSGTIPAIGSIGAEVPATTVEGPVVPETHKNKDKDQELGTEDSATGSDEDEYVACILEDHGKSLKLGLVEGDLQGVLGVPHSICIPKQACLEDVAEAFGVEGSYQRGYCAHNPNVRRLSQVELRPLLDAVMD